MSLDADLVRLLKRLKLGQLVPTLPERLALARAQQLDYAAFLTLLLADEVQRREQQALERHLDQAGFEERVTLDDFDWSSPVHLDRQQLQHVFTLQFLQRKEHVILVGPVGIRSTLPLLVGVHRQIVQFRHALSSMRRPLRLPDSDLDRPQFARMDPMQDRLFGAAERLRRLIQADPTRLEHRGTMRAMTSSVTWIRQGA